MADLNQTQQLATDAEINARSLNVPHKPHHFLSKKVGLLGALFLLLALVSIIGILSIRPSQSPSSSVTSSPTPSVNPLDTSSWKTHVTGDLSFSLRYPPTDWLLYDTNVTTPANSTVTNEITIQALPNPTRLTSTQYGDTLLKGNPKFDPLKIKRQKIVVNGMATEKIYDLPGKASNIRIYVPYQNQMYLILFQTKGLLSKQFESTVDQIIESLTFLDTTKSITPAPSQEAVVCTLDAKICSDGSSVGRVPPSCEFAACPSN